ncbi:HpcH/HpaI aldolase family protein [Rhizobium leguminosarum]|uniref:HpcH/HpaI aldolase family protein n=1 Tax=Rhizobium leguminosarum TaxID=384 RepID=UPI00102FB312|nr:aldolase/citrate lyase family protein [Rhizobium leguminosarum]TAV84008.1 hydroxyacid aldolase [Rhizobium leguminosarum]TAV84586.1 hydroxyacid aldolase [Rhizobium leguminosarum]TAW27021.1 hydroxyacid aldolase [Rhizobium leguminosarum]TAX24606.1 hydroxyacid aldolase [Rhizobium leguminosarum]TAY25115.1 hydroxyacid aldolase [Rhizobium leguminosarum]
MSAAEIDGFADRIRQHRGGMISAWIGIPDATLANHLAQEAFDAIVLDMQHGMWDMPSAANAVAQVRLAGKPALARIPVGDFASASRLLDAGASGIIAPMINSAEDAQAFVKTTKYPPLGDRSWGPSLALNHTGLSADDYLKNANALTVAIAMVETRAALEAIDDILGVAGIDGIFIGPSDLSIALSNGDQVAPNAAEIDSAMQHAVSRCRAHGKFAGAFAGDGERAGELLKFGFDLVIAGAETAQLRSGARRAINAARRIASA